MDQLKADISFDDFYKLDLRVAKVVWAAKIDGALRLLKLTLDVGPLGQRTVVTQLGESYDASELLGRRVVYLANTKAKRVRGMLSRGSVLTTSQVLVVPDVSVRVGSIIV